MKNLQKSKMILWAMVTVVVIVLLIAGYLYVGINSTQVGQSSIVIPTSTTTSPATTGKPSIVITYPQAGMTLDDSGMSTAASTNKPVTIVQWKEVNGNNPVSIYLLNKNNQIMGSLEAIQIPNTGSYVWNYDPYLLNGKYQIVIAINGTLDHVPNSNDAYSGYFTVINSPQEQNSGSPLMEGR